MCFAGNAGISASIYIIGLCIFSKGSTREVKTYRFEESKLFLESLGVPCDELQFYPDIQYMEEERIKVCIERLQKEGFHVVFSLFLIQRINDELMEEEDIASGRAGEE